MPLPSRLRYCKSLTYTPSLLVPLNLYERLRFRLRDEVDSTQQPFELCMLANNVASQLFKFHGRNVSVKDILGILREATRFRARFSELVARRLRPTATHVQEDSQLTQVQALQCGNRTYGFIHCCHPIDSISLVAPYMMSSTKDYDAHVEALRHLWFGPTSGIDIEADWYFEIPESNRPRLVHH
jgi:hypothetical protein